MHMSREMTATHALRAGDQIMRAPNGCPVAAQLSASCSAYSCSVERTRAHYSALHACAHYSALHAGARADSRSLLVPPPTSPNWTRLILGSSLGVVVASCYTSASRLTFSLLLCCDAASPPSQ